jgi:protein-disulfide isomerase
MEKYKEYLTPGAIVLAGLMISASLLMASGISFPSQGLSANVADTGGSINNAAGVAGAAPVVTDQDYIRGNPNAPITIVEYSDFECPFCGQFHPTVQQALAEYGDQVRWVYRHFPLTQIHPAAVPSAEASECVAEQKGSEGFWQFVDVMFENQRNLGPALYRQEAQKIGVNIAQFDNCVATNKYAEKVQADQASGTALGVSGTPGSFVNDTPLRGALPYASLKSIIDKELQELGN